MEGSSIIVFKRVTWANFLSTGDQPTTINLDRSPSTLIVGHNGSGKSTLLDALAFALFNKPHRDIKKTQLVNSINQKRCLVEVEFAVGNSEFKVVRGIKPTKFEIWQNGQQINQDSNARDFQKFLEQTVLKLNHKSFHQIVVLGSSSFVPFMQLSTAHRREVIEDLLDIGIFSRMNGVLKERQSKLKEEIGDVQHQISVIKEKITLQKRYITDISQLNDEIRADKDLKIQEKQTDIQRLIDENDELSKFSTANEKDNRKRFSELAAVIEDLKGHEVEHKTRLTHLMTDHKFFDENTVCPTCDQSIEDGLRRYKITEVRAEAFTVDAELKALREQRSELAEEYGEIQTLLEQVHKAQSQIHYNNVAIASLQRDIDGFNRDIDSMKTGDIAAANAALEQLLTDSEALGHRKSDLADQRNDFEAVAEMLKDTGIKTKIIKQYLPAMNKLINQYLSVLDFFVSFHIDENFNEVIKSRHRDDFNYASFSEGEKQRIDLALLFTWRQIAKMKNSTSTNLLVLDETFDSSLDVDGVENLTKILNTLDEGTNVFIISHKGELLENKFRSRIEFKKTKNFSVMTT